MAMIDYKNIIQSKNVIPNERIWWSEYLYHFSDAHNIASILSDGIIYSRRDALQMNKMKNDNASEVVIDHTAFITKGFAKLYFRPKTPTQYHNEGYKPIASRDVEMNASCPVPVFLLMDINAVLNMSDAYFVEKGLAGNGHPFRHGIEEFERLDFYKIYHDGGYDKETQADIKEYRQSEVVREGGIPVEPYLKCIVCRSSAEKDMLMFLLKSYSLDLYEKYKNKIMYRPKINCFFYNGVFVESVQWSGDSICFKLSDPRFRKNIGNTVHFTATIDMQMFGECNVFFGNTIYSGEYDYNVIDTIYVKLNLPQDTDYIKVKMSFDDSVMYENRLDVRNIMVV